MYNRALSSNEVAALYAMESTPPAPPVTTDTFGTGSNQFGIDFVTVGNAGNSDDTTGYGGVPYSYRIGKYTISQNQVVAATRNGLQNVTAGAWTGDQPAANISWYEAAAYVNWLNTNAGSRPAYNLTFTNGSWSMALWPTTPDTNGNVAWTLGGTNLFRNANCTYFLPSENEWYKAAYYDPNKISGSGGYWLYPTGSDTAPTPVASGTAAGTAVYNAQLNPASVFLSGGLSPYGTMGQGGVVWQWVENATGLGDDRVLRGGYRFYSDHDNTLASSYRPSYYPNYEGDNQSGGLGFRIASVDDSWLTNGLVAYYPFHGDFLDYSGRNHTAVLNGSGITFGTNQLGDVDKAAKFNGNGFLTITPTPFKVDEDFSLSIWCYGNGSINHLNNCENILSTGTDRYGALNLRYRSNLSPKWVGEWGWYIGQNQPYAIGGDLQIYISNWNLVTYVRKSNSSHYYLNGALVQSLDGTASPTDGGSLWVGRHDYPDPNAQFPFFGSLSELRIYNRALSSNEVAQLYAYESIPPVPVPSLASQSITFPVIPTLTLTNTPYTLGATADSGLPVTYAIGDSSIAGITNGNLIPLGVGTTTVVATQAGDTNYLAATPVTNPLVITYATQAYTPSGISNQTYGSLPFGLTLPTNSSGLPVTARIVSGPATLSGTNLTITGTGTVTLAYDAPGNTLYASNSVTNSFAVTNGPTNLKSQTITFKALSSAIFGGKAIAPSATASSKLPVTFWSSNTNVAVINGTNVVITGAGQSVITAYQPGDGTTWNPAAPASRTLVVNQASQKLTFKGPAKLTYSSTPVTLSGSSSFGLPVSYTCSDSNVARLSTSGTNTLLTPVGTGTVTVTATQPGNANVGAAIPVAQPVVIAPGTQTLTFTLASTNAVYGDSPITLSATSSAGLPVTFSVTPTNVASGSGNTLTITGAGKAKITASQTGSALWAAVKPVTKTLTIAKAPQTISLSLPSSVTYTNGGLLSLAASSTSGLPVAYKSGNAKVLFIQGTNCMISGKGTTTVVATQAGNANYLAAPAVTNTITVR